MTPDSHLTLESELSSARGFIRAAHDSGLLVGFLLQTLNWSVWNHKIAKSEKGKWQESGAYKDGKIGF